MWTEIKFAKTTFGYLIFFDRLGLGVFGIFYLNIRNLATDYKKITDVVRSKKKKTNRPFLR